MSCVCWIQSILYTSPTGVELTWRQKENQFVKWSHYDSPWAWSHLPWLAGARLSAQSCSRGSSHVCITFTNGPRKEREESREWTSAPREHIRMRQTLWTTEAIFNTCASIGIGAEKLRAQGATTADESELKTLFRQKGQTQKANAGNEMETKSHASVYHCGVFVRLSKQSRGALQSQNAGSKHNMEFF